MILKLLNTFNPAGIRIDPTSEGRYLKVEQWYEQMETNERSALLSGRTWLEITEDLKWGQWALALPHGDNRQPSMLTLDGKDIWQITLKNGESEPQAHKVLQSLDAAPVEVMVFNKCHDALMSS
jgi:hypothetical protein